MKQAKTGRLWTGLRCRWCALGVLEAMIVVGALKRGHMPVNQDPEADIKLVNKHNNHKPIKTAISNSFSFGGHDVVIAFGKA